MIPTVKCVHLQSFLISWKVRLVRKGASATRKFMKEKVGQKKQAAVLADSLGKFYEEIETFKQSSNWFKVKDTVDKYGRPKSLKQMKGKLRNLKDAYKAVKDSNKQTGAAPVQYVLPQI